MRYTELMPFSVTPQQKTFVLGLSISILILFAFFGGALADRIFVVKPLDVLTGTARLPVSKGVVKTANQDSLLDDSLGRSSSWIADIVAVSADSVVTVASVKQQRVTVPGDAGIFGLLDGGETKIATEQLRQVQQAVGTGFAVEGDFVITNRHVVADVAAEYKIIDTYQREYQVTNVYRDPSNDLAILKVAATDLPRLPLGNSDAIRVGESTIVIGTVLGEFRQTVTTGIVSGLGRGITAVEGSGVEALDGVIQTDAAINPGNSGGPVLNDQGQVIGVAVASSTVGQNIGFAIPINVVKASLDNFNQTGQFDRANLGILYRMISPEAAAFNNVPEGAYVVEVSAGSAAGAAGLQPEDIITHFAGNALTSSSNLGALINQQKIGSSVEITFWRSGKTQKAAVTF